MSESPKPVAGPEPSPISAADSLEQIMSDLRSTPLFMTSLDDAGEDNLAVEALRSMVLDEPPEETAQNLKNEGNECFKAKRYKDALQYYTRAIESDQHDNTDLKVALLINRAAVNLELQNYGRVLEDCAAALRMRPETPKALYRSARACLALGKYDEADECCRWGIQTDPSNAEMAKLQKKIADAREAENKRIKAREQREAERQRKRELLKQAIGIRKGLVFDKSSGKKKTGEHPWENDSDRQVSLDESTGHLQWPVFFLYPEHKESDFIEKFDEATTLGDMLRVVLQQPPQWDSQTSPSYTPDKVDLYFLHRPVGGFDEDERLIKVGASNALGTVLEHERYVIRDGIPSFVVLPRGSPFAAQFIERYRQLRLAREAATKKA
ncbi:HSP70/90 co-chaperone [Coemansia sp. Benny D115]|nr:HSP70/90 co-chaperone [Coemansia sp. Benny D115]